MHISPRALPANNLFQELIQKDSEIKSTYQEFKSQIYGELIPRNHFFEWVGNKTLPERQVQIVHHFKSLAKFNDFHVYVLTDKPMKFIAAESSCDGISGAVDVITVDQLNEDFYKALKNSKIPDCDKLHKDFVNSTRLHNAGLENQALRIHYYRLALLYTYGGIHSDINIPLKELDSSASAIQPPLIPLKGKNGLLMQTLDYSDGYGPTVSIPTNSLIASLKNNQIILSMIKNMLKTENKLKGILIEASDENDFKKTLTLHDAMRLWQCKEEYFVKAHLEHLKTIYEIDRAAVKTARSTISEESVNSTIDNLKDHIIPALKIRKRQGYAELKPQGLLTARHCVVTKIFAGGTNALTSLLQRQYKGPEDFIEYSGFPLPNNQPSYANIKPVRDASTFLGLGSWYGKPNPHYVDDNNL